MQTTSRVIISLLISSLLLGGCATRPSITQELVAGQHAFAMHQYSLAYDKLIRPAIFGNPSAQYAVGYLFYHGLGVKQDQAKALTWFKSAAKKGNYRAIIALQKLHEHAQQQMLLQTKH